MPASLAFAEARPPAPVCLHLSSAVRGLMALRPDGCRWPIGDVAREDFTFCGRPRPGRASYCASHKALACEAVR